MYKQKNQKLHKKPVAKKVQKKKVAKKVQKPVQAVQAVQAVRTYRTSAPLRSEPAAVKKEVKPYLDFTLVSPNFQPYVNAAVHQVYVSTTKGDRGILRNAAPALATLRPGVLKVYKDAGEKNPEKFFVPGGVLRIANDDHALVVTASEIIPFDHLDVDAAKKLLDQANNAIATTTDPQQKAEHTITMSVAKAMIQVLESKH
eukprot:UN02520